MNCWMQPPQSSITETKRPRPRPGRRKEGRNPGMPKWWLPYRAKLPPKGHWLYSPKETKVTFVARWATGHRSAPIEINLLRLLAINSINQDTGWPFAPRSKGTEDQRLLPSWLPKTEEAPIQQIHMTGLEPRVQTDVAGKSTIFLLDTGASYSVLTSFSGPFSQTCTIMGVTGKPFCRPFTIPLSYVWEGFGFSHRFLHMLDCPSPFLGRDLLQKWNATLSLPRRVTWTPSRGQPLGNLRSSPN